MAAPLETLALTLGNLGFEIEDPCDPSSILEVLADETAKMVERVEDAIDDLLGKSGGSVLAALSIIVAHMAKDVARDYVNGFVSDLMSKGFGAVLGAVAAALGSAARIEIIIQYYAVQHLMAELEKRKELGFILKNDVASVATVLLSIKNTIHGRRGDDPFKEITSSQYYIKRAGKIVSGEINRMKSQNGSFPRTSYLKTASTSLEEAIDSLSGNFFKEIKKRKDEIIPIFNKYGMNVSSVEILSPTLLKNDIQDRFFSVPSNIGDAEKESYIEEQNTAFTNFMSEVTPVLPKDLQTFLLESSISGVIDRLVELMPITAIKYTRDMLNLGSGSSNDFSNQIGSSIAGKKETEHAMNYMSDPSKKNTHWKRVMGSVSVANGAITLFSSNWGILKILGSSTTLLLSPALSTISDVSVDVKGFLDKDTKTKIGAFGKKRSWVTKLTSAQTQLKAVIGEKADEDGNPVPSSQDDLESFDVAQERFENLRIYIKDTFNKKESAKNAFKQSQVSLTPVGMGIMGVVLGGVNSRTIGQLKSVQSSITNQILHDDALYGYCLSFMSSVEQVNDFPKLKKKYDDLISTMPESMKGPLSLGNISNIVATLSGDSLEGSALGELLGCLNIKTMEGFPIGDPTRIVREKAQEASAKLMGLGEGLADFKVWNEDAEDTMNELEDAYILIDKLYTQVKDVIEKLATARAIGAN